MTHVYQVTVKMVAKKWISPAVCRDADQTR